MYSTHIKANANKQKFNKKLTRIKAKAHHKELEKKINEQQIKEDKKTFGWGIESALKEEAEELRCTDTNKHLYKRRKETIECVFADAKKKA